MFGLLIYIYVYYYLIKCATLEALQIEYFNDSYSLGLLTLALII